MATFTIRAEVLTPDHWLMQAFTAGVTQKYPGTTLQDVLDRNGGKYQTVLPIPPAVREEIRNVAELTSDKHLLAIADLGEVTVPLEHLRGIDPQTRVAIGAELNYAPGESERLGLGKQEPPDPKTSILVENE